MIGKLRWIVVVLVCVCVSGRLYAQPALTPYPPADIQFGARIFAAQCVVCHGATGNLVFGVDLRSGQLRRASSDGELRTVITTGVPATAMPPFKLNPSELTGIVAYLRNMRTFDASNVTLGDAARGKALFEGKGGCGRCHRVNGVGPRLAPDLSAVGSIRTADALQRVLLDPSTADASVRSVRAVTRDGKFITGRRLNEDTHTVQLIDERERLLSLMKSDLREYNVIKEPSMPSYKNTLSPAELGDLVAYLLSLTGQP